MTAYLEKPVTVDAFDTPESWKSVASGLAQMKISSKFGPAGHALKLDFDFHGGGGFVVARKELPRPLTGPWEFRFRLRGNMLPNRFELKITDGSGSSVWRWLQEPLIVNGRWKKFSVPSSQMRFAWGPAGGGVPTEIGAIEFVIGASNGGSGFLLIDSFEWVDVGPLAPHAVQATSGNPRGLLTEAGAAWCAAENDRRPRLEFDFGRKREFGGVILHWAPGAARDVTLQIRHGREWRPVLELQHVGGRCTPIPFSGPATRRVKLCFQPGAGLERIEWKGPEFSHSDDEFLHAMAEESPEGAFPKYWLRRQTLLTPAGSPSGAPRAMMNEEGLIETDEAGFSLEPFLFCQNNLTSWANAKITRSLEGGWMPLPEVHWDAGPLALDIAARTGKVDTGSALIASYTVENRLETTLNARLHVVARPFQATPPWQHHGHIGGKSPISSAKFEGATCWINGLRTVVPLDPPSHIGAHPFASGRLFTRLAADDPPTCDHIVDPLGLAEAVYTFDLTLAAGERITRRLLVPFGATPHGQAIVPVEISEQAARREWETSLEEAVFDTPPAWKAAAETWRAATAHILVNREAHALHPGPRRYNRAWIRDGVVMGAALARAGGLRAFTGFIDWYAQWLRNDGQVPCCVDRDGVDWLAEYDSQGQWLYGIAECHRFGAGDAFALAHWPSVMRCVSHIRELRERRPDEGYDLPDKRPFRGLLPESASHEGYLAHHVHAYWDDFWAIRGLRDAHALAVELKRPPAECHIIAALRDALTHSVETSLRATMELRGIDYIPGSVEWADFDPSATAVAVMILDGLGVLPEDGLAVTFDRYMQGFRDRFFGNQPWTNYSAYEMRVVTALTRLGRRDDAHAVLRFLLDDRQPKEWHQWPEITWKDRQSPGHFGDLPHSWIGAEYVLGFAGLFAYEREADDSLVLAAGLPDDWFDQGRTNGVTGLPTYYGRLSYSLERGENGWRIDIAPLERSPRGGIDVRLPVSAAGGLLLASGREHRIGSDGSVRLFGV